MGAITEVSVEYSRTVQPRQYESERLAVGLTSTVDDGDLHEAVIGDLLTEARTIVQGTLAGYAELRRVERARSWRGAPPKPAVDEEDDPERPF